ncbi:MAG: MaoC family dehydratase N-terminal domain-containing protein [Gemmatimonadota bacterium]
MTLDLTGWTREDQVVQEILAPGPARGFAALLDRDTSEVHDGAILPVGWHWFYMNPAVPRSEWGEDGHPRRGSFLPPIPLPRRMWAGGRLRFLAPLKLGQRAERRSRVLTVEEKTGRSGRFVLATVSHTISGPDGVAIEEEQDLIYRDPPEGKSKYAGGAVPPANAEEWSEPYRTDPVVLFRFSALTSNGHRIHYDHPYTTEVEGYPGLVVHGPLQALLLLEAASARAGVRPVGFRYRAVSPVFVGEPLELRGGPAKEGVMDVRAVGPRGPTMQASAEFGAGG